MAWRDGRGERGQFRQTYAASALLHQGGLFVNRMKRNDVSAEPMRVVVSQERTLVLSYLFPLD